MEKERVTITLAPSVLKAVDSLVDGKAVRNRSHAIETLLSQCLGVAKNALVLAGKGGSSRAMTVVNGRPVVARTVDWLVKNGIRDIFFCVDEGEKNIKSQFQKCSGFCVSFHEEDKPLGTGGSLRVMADKFNSTFVVCYGDILVDFDLHSMLSFHKDNKATVTVALKSVKETNNVGIALLDGARITGFSEKPAEAATSLANAGVYVMEPEVFSYIGPNSSFEKDVLPKLIAEGKCFGYAFSGPWVDIGSPGSKEKAKKLFK